jgi:hypothetical protein
MGVSIPDDFRGEMAMPGEWTVTSTRVIDEAGEVAEGKQTAKGATGVRKREDTEEHKEEEDAVRGLFKKPRRWGRDSKTTPEGEQEELDALLSGTVKLKDALVKDEVEDAVKEEPDAASRILGNEEKDGEANVKVEDGGGDGIAPVVFKKRKPKGLRTK